MKIDNIQPDSGKDYLIYTKKSVCDLCRGLCCKTSAGIYAPEDFKEKITTPFLIHLLLTKMFTIENVGEGDSSEYFLRPKHIDENPINPEPYGGLCVNWKSDVGCLLSESERPYQCRTLIPLADGVTCQHKPSDKALKVNMISRWYPYQYELKMACVNYTRLVKTFSHLYHYDEDIRVADIYDGIAEKMEKIQSVIGMV